MFDPVPQSNQPDQTARTTQKRVLTGIALARLLRRLADDPTEAGLAYERLRHKLEFWFEQRRVSDPATLADQTLDRVALRLGDDVAIENVTAYALGVAANVHHEHLRSIQAREVALDTESNRYAEPSVWPSAFDDTQRENCLNRCLARLRGADRAFLQSYYDDDWDTQVERRKTLAARFGLKPVGLRTRAFRLRDKLESCAQGCLKGKK